jgi:hypothetical protein
MSCATAAARDDTAVAEQERKASAAAVVTHGGVATAAARCHIAQQGAAVAESTEGHPSAAAASSVDAAVPPNWLTSLMSMNGLQLDPAVLQLIAASDITPDEFAGLTYEALKRRFPSLCINNRLMTMRLVNAAADARALDRNLRAYQSLHKDDVVVVSTAFACLSHRVPN